MTDFKVAINLTGVLPHDVNSAYMPTRPQLLEHAANVGVYVLPWVDPLGYFAGEEPPDPAAMFLDGQVILDNAVACFGAQGLWERLVHETAGELLGYQVVAHADEFSVMWDLAREVAAEHGIAGARLLETAMETIETAVTLSLDPAIRVALGVVDHVGDIAPAWWPGAEGWETYTPQLLQEAAARLGEAEGAWLRTPQITTVLDVLAASTVTLRTQPVDVLWEAQREPVSGPWSKPWGGLLAGGTFGRIGVDPPSAAVQTLLLPLLQLHADNCAALIGRGTQLRQSADDDGARRLFMRRWSHLARLACAEVAFERLVRHLAAHIDLVELLPAWVQTPGSKGVRPLLPRYISVGSGGPTFTLLYGGGMDVDKGVLSDAAPQAIISALADPEQLEELLTGFEVLLRTLVGAYNEAITTTDQPTQVLTVSADVPRRWADSPVLHLPVALKSPVFMPDSSAAHTLFAAYLTPLLDHATTVALREEALGGCTLPLSRLPMLDASKGAAQRASLQVQVRFPASRDVTWSYVPFDQERWAQLQPYGAQPEVKTVAEALVLLPESLRGEISTVASTMVVLLKVDAEAVESRSTPRAALPWWPDALALTEDGELFGVQLLYRMYFSPALEGGGR